VASSLSALAWAKLNAGTERGPTRKYGWTSNPKAGRLVDGDSLERLMENRLWRAPTQGVFRQDPRVVTPASNQGIHDERSRGARSLC